MSSNPFIPLTNASFLAEALRGLMTAIPVLIGVIPVGLLLGTQAQQQGFSVLNLSFLTGLNFGGGSEFAALALWTWPPNLVSILMVTFLVNSRHLVMGASLAPYIRHLPTKKVLPALFFMCDETWAMSISDSARRRHEGVEHAFSPGFYAGIAASMWSVWICSTAAGVVVGPWLGDISIWGFDMAFPAVFFVILKGMWKGCSTALPWLVSLVSAASVYHFFPGSAYVPVGAISGIFTIMFMVKNK